MKSLELARTLQVAQLEVFACCPRLERPKLPAPLRRHVPAARDDGDEGRLPGRCGEEVLSVEREGAERRRLLTDDSAKRERRERRAALAKARHAKMREAKHRTTAGDQARRKADGVEGG